MEAENRELRFASKGRARLMRIETQKKSAAVCHNDNTPSVKAQTIDELHCLQKKKSAPNTSRIARTPGQGQGAATFAIISKEDLQKQQLQSIR
nr:phosphoenolpyruvate carboxykinase (atp) [Quercus suber]